jgi:hypothetical protein
MKTLTIALLSTLLTGCSHYNPILSDVDCQFVGKPNDYKLPSKCGPKSYSKSSVVIRKTSPHTYTIYK